MSSDSKWFETNRPWLLPFLYFFARLVLFLALIPDDFYGFGDFPVYGSWTSLPGWPYLDYWVEYPPLFPFISEGLYRLAGGGVFLYDFLLAILLALAGAVGLGLFQRISERLHGPQESFQRALVYFAVTVALPYTWWYYEPLPVMLFLGGLWAVLQKRDQRAGVWIGLGILAKWFPLFLLPGLFRYRPTRSILKIAGSALGLALLVFALLYALSPEMTRASLLSQPARSSWQTAWALMDGNLTTGEFVLPEERFVPEAAVFPRGNPAVVSSRLTLLVFGGLGLWLLWRKRDSSDQAYVAFSGITWALFLLWSPGWSPQWILYLIPLILLSLPLGKGVLLNLLLVLVTIFEWPLLLKRDLFAALWLLVPLRMALLTALIVLWVKSIYRPVLPPGPGAEPAA